MRTFKALSALLAYPDEPLLEALPEIRRCLEDEKLLPDTAIRDVARLLDHMGSNELMALQEDYVALFDRTRRLSLHLYEHLYGESRDRGQAMARLAIVYRMHGFNMDARELPDYLPLICEFLSLVDLKRARAILADAVSVLEALRVRLAERESPYEAALAALLTLADKRVDKEMLAEILSRHPDDEESEETLDDLWEEKPVTFGPENSPDGGCGSGAYGMSPHQSGATARSVRP